MRQRDGWTMGGSAGSPRAQRSEQFSFSPQRTQRSRREGSCARRGSDSSWWKSETKTAFTAKGTKGREIVLSVEHPTFYAGGACRQGAEYAAGKCHQLGGSRRIASAGRVRHAKPYDSQARPGFHAFPSSAFASLAVESASRPPTNLNRTREAKAKRLWLARKRPMCDCLCTASLFPELSLRRGKPAGACASS
jgi:hypothetical protein